MLHSWRSQRRRSRALGVVVQSVMPHRGLQKPPERMIGRIGWELKITDQLTAGQEIKVPAEVAAKEAGERAMSAWLRANGLIGGK